MAGVAAGTPGSGLSGTVTAGRPAAPLRLGAGTGGVRMAGSTARAGVVLLPGAGILGPRGWLQHLDRPLLRPRTAETVIAVCAERRGIG